MEAKPAQATQKFEVAGKTFAAPASWEKEQPSSNMRKAQFRTVTSDDGVRLFIDNHL